MSVKSPELVFKHMRNCFDAIEFFPEKDPRFVKPAKLLIAAIGQWVEPDGHFTINISEFGVRFNQTQFPQGFLQQSDVKWFMRTVEPRGIHDIVFVTGVEPSDIAALSDILHVPPSQFNEFESISDRLASTGVTKIRLNEIAKVHAHQVADNALEVVTEEDKVVVEDGTPRRLFISEEESKTLHDTLVQFIQEGNLEKVANIFKMIRVDMQSSDRPTRELGFSSFQVVAKTLVEAKQAKPLAGVLNSMSTDFHQIEDEDLFWVHVDSLMALLEFFRENDQLTPVVFGLHIFSNLIIESHGDRRSVLQLQLDSLMDTSLLEQLLRVESWNPIYKQIQNLFKQRGLGLLRSLFKGLWDLDDRHLRKRILDYLQRLGPAIYPELMEELRKKTMVPTPWYVKRNILMLLSTEPPVELVPYLEGMLVDEKQDKLLEMIYKCLFHIHDQQAIALSAKLLEEASPGELSRMVLYLGQAREHAFTKALLNRYPQEEDEVKAVILAGLGRLGSEDGFKLLKEVLSTKGSLFGGKAKDILRVAAAKALVNSPHSESASFLKNFRKDSLPEVRKAAEKVH